ncbi:MAG: substrate-binding periplasmic protein [Aeromonas sp.]
MKWITHCLLLGLWAPMALAKALCPEPVQVGYDNWPPYHYHDVHSSQQVHGYAVEVLTAVLAAMECKVSYVELPRKRILHEMEFGKIEIAMEASVNDERARYALFSDSYHPGHTLLWIRKGSDYPEQNLADWLASGHSLGVTKGYFYGDEVMALLGRYGKQVSAVNDKQNYEKLARGRIDGFLGDNLATFHKLNSEGMNDKFVNHTMQVYESPSVFMLSKRRFSPAFLQQFNQALARFKKSDAYAVILHRYISES